MARGGAGAGARLAAAAAAVAGLGVVAGAAAQAGGVGGAGAAWLRRAVGGWEARAQQQALQQLQQEMVGDFLAGLRAEPGEGGAMEALFGAVREAEQHAADAVERGTLDVLAPLMQALESGSLISEEEAGAYVDRVSGAAVRAFAHLQDWGSEAAAMQSLYDEVLAGPFEVAQHVSEQVRSGLEAEVELRLTKALRNNGRLLDFMYPAVPGEDRLNWGVRVAKEYAALFNVDNSRAEQAAAMENFGRELAVPICVLEEEVAGLPEALPEPLKVAQRTVAFMLKGLSQRLQRLNQHGAAPASSQAHVLRHYMQRFGALRRDSWQDILDSNPALAFLQKACDDHKNGVWTVGENGPQDTEAEAAAAETEEDPDNI